MRIVQTGKTVPTSLRTKAMVSNIRLLHPEYEYVFYDDLRVEKFIDEEFPEYKRLFNSFPYRIQRYDFFRYLVIYRYGGFYFDLDMLMASDVSKLLDSGCVFPFEGLTFSHHLRTACQMDWEIGNYAFGAAPGHPFLEKVISNCVRAQEDPEWVKPMMRKLPMLSMPDFKVLNTTGPGLLSRTLAENSDLAASTTVLFPKDVCDPSSWNCFGELGVHLMEGSWRPGGRLHRRLAGYLELWRLKELRSQSKKLGPVRYLALRSNQGMDLTEPYSTPADLPLVSILIPAFNARETIAKTIESAIAQTWPRKEIVVVDDGSLDETLSIARQFQQYGIKVFTHPNQGAAVARNNAFARCHGDYIQWLDADDLLAPDKISRQMNSIDWNSEKKVLLSSAWGQFLYRQNKATFKPNALWQNLTPKEWLVFKLGSNLFMQTATWLVSREVTEAAGPWDVRLVPNDDDGEYFCRVLMVSQSVRFVPDARVYYRSPGIAFRGLSHIGQSQSKLEACWLSVQLHIQYLRSLEKSERVDQACLEFLQTSLIYFYPEREDIVGEAKKLATELGGELHTPELSWKYSWIERAVGLRKAKEVRRYLQELRWSASKTVDKVLFLISDQSRNGFLTSHGSLKDRKDQTANANTPTL